MFSSLSLADMHSINILLRQSLNVLFIHSIHTLCRLSSNDFNVSYGSQCKVFKLTVSSGTGQTALIYQKVSISECHWCITSQELILADYHSSVQATTKTNGKIYWNNHLLFWKRMLRERKSTDFYLKIYIIFMFCHFWMPLFQGYSNISILCNKIFFLAWIFNMIEDLFYRKFFNSEDSLKKKIK